MTSACILNVCLSLLLLLMVEKPFPSKERDGLLPNQIWTQKYSIPGGNYWSWILDISFINGASFVYEIFSIKMHVNACMVYTSNKYLASNTQSKPDSLIWKRGAKGRFKVRAYHQLLRSSVGSIPKSPWKCIWRNKETLKVEYFTWLVAHGGYLTRENLQKRGLHICSRCPLCEREIRMLTTSPLIAHSPCRSGISFLT